MHHRMESRGLTDFPLCSWRVQISKPHVPKVESTLPCECEHVTWTCFPLSIENSVHMGISLYSSSSHSFIYGGKRIIGCYPRVQVVYPYSLDGRPIRNTNTLKGTCPLPCLQSRYCQKRSPYKIGLLWFLLCNNNLGARTFTPPILIAYPEH